MAPPIRLNLMNPSGNSYAQYQYYASQNNFNTTLNQSQGQFRGFRGNRFGAMLAQVVNSKPGCSSCGK
jgi:hypothetical protein